MTPNSFGKKQIEIVWYALKNINPKIIVVANALVSKIMQSYFKDYLSTFHEDMGFHTIKINDRNVPIFFSGMLTGQRALDNHTYKRLKWHIGKSVKTKIEL